MYRLSLIRTKSAAIPVAIFPVETAPGAAFAFPIVATTDPMAVMTIPVAAVHAVTVPLAVVAVLAPPHTPILGLPFPLPDKPPAGPTALSEANARHPRDRPAMAVDVGCTRGRPP